MLRKPAKEPEADVLRRSLHSAKEQIANLQAQIENLTVSASKLEDENGRLNGLLKSTQKSAHIKPLSPEAKQLLAVTVDGSMSMNPHAAKDRTGWEYITVNTAIDDLVREGCYEISKEHKDPMLRVYVATSKGIQAVASRTETA